MEENIKMNEKLVPEDYIKMSSFLKPVRDILGENCVIKIRMSDPRVVHYSIYVRLNKDYTKRILNAYRPKIDRYDQNKVTVEYSFFKRIRTIDVSCGGYSDLPNPVKKESFTIYNVPNKKREELILEHDFEQNEQLTKDKEQGKIY